MSSNVALAKSRPLQKKRMSPPCASQAMLLVALQLGLIAASVAACKQNTLCLARASSWQATLLSLILMLGGIAGLMARQSQAVTIGAWCCFSLGALILGLQLARYDTKALRRGLLQAVLLLVIVAAAAPGRARCGRPASRRQAPCSSRLGQSTTSSSGPATHPGSKAWKSSWMSSISSSSRCADIHTSAASSALGQTFRQ